MCRHLYAWHKPCFSDDGALENTCLWSGVGRKAITPTKNHEQTVPANVTSVPRLILVLQSFLDAFDIWINLLDIFEFDFKMYDEHHLRIQQCKMKLLLRTTEVPFCSKLKLSSCVQGSYIRTFSLPWNHLSYNGNCLGKKTNWSNRLKIHNKKQPQVNGFGN